MVASAVVRLLCLLCFCAGAFGSEKPLAWGRDDRAAFAQARAEQRFVLLYLEAVWCHWCHVMDHETYQDPKVRELLAAHYVPLRIDQDSRPDLANRYRDYGWPATIVLAADGTEIVKRRGFIPPERFAKLLQAIVADPSPELLDRRDADAAPSKLGALSTTLRAELTQRHVQSYDERVGGLRHTQKYLDRDSVEWASTLAARGDAQEAKRARQTLSAALALLDPVWGGFYQYSTHGDWRHPHFEKLTTLQGDYLRVYAFAYAQFGDASYLAAAQAQRRYIDAFLRANSGGYFASQDADLRPGEHSAAYFALDDVARRKQGAPRVAPQTYTRESAAIAEGLAALSETAQDADALGEAVAAVRWALANRGLPGGGFRHDSVDAGGPYLGDNLRMGRAFLALYRADASREWLKRAGDAADFIEQNFRAKAGYLTAVQGDAPIAPVATTEENIQLARFTNLLHRYTGAPQHRAIAEHALAFLAQPQIALATFTEPGILLAEYEIANEPLHLTVLGAKSDPNAQALYRAALLQPGWYKRVEWWDAKEGPLPNPDVSYPQLKRAAAFVCNASQCSLPIFEPAGIKQFLADAQGK